MSFKLVADDIITKIMGLTLSPYGLALGVTEPQDKHHTYSVIITKNISTTGDLNRLANFLRKEILTELKIIELGQYPEIMTGEVAIPSWFGLNYSSDTPETLHYLLFPLRQNGRITGIFLTFRHTEYLPGSLNFSLIQPILAMFARELDYEHLDWNNQSNEAYMT